MKDDEGTEDFLRRFQPRPAPALLPPEARRPSRWLIAAAVALAAGGAWLGHRAGPPRGRPPAERLPLAEPMPPMTLSLAAIRSADVGALDRFLDAEARRSLPDVTRPDGALRTLAAVGDGL